MYECTLCGSNDTAHFVPIFPIRIRCIVGCISWIQRYAMLLFQKLFNITILLKYSQNKNTYRLPTNLANSGRFSHLGKDETIVLPQLTSNTPEQFLSFIQTRLAFEMSTNCPYFCSSHSLFRIFLSPYTTKIYHVHFKGYKDSITIEHYQCTYKSCKTLISDSDRVAIFQIFEPIKYINRLTQRVTE